MARVDRLTEPDALLDLEVAKEHLRVSHDFEDSYVERLVSTATQQAEGYLARALRPRTLAYVLDCGFPEGVIALPMPPLIEVTSIVYIDVNGIARTLDPTEYAVSAPTGPNAQRGRIAPATTWPTTQRALDAVRITYRAGYADGSVPTPIEQGILLRVAEMFCQRGDDVDETNGTSSARHLWQAFKVYP